MISRRTFNGDNNKLELNVDSAASQSVINDIANKGDKGGHKTEAVMDATLVDHGFTVLAGGKYGSNNGFDHVGVYKDAAGNTVMTLLIDSKQLNSKGIALAKGAGDATQLTQQWIDAVITALPQNSPAVLAIQDALNNGNLTKAVAFVDKKIKP